MASRALAVKIFLKNSGLLFKDFNLLIVQGN